MKDQQPQVEPKTDRKQLGKLLLIIACVVFISSYLTYIYFSTQSKNKVAPTFDLGINNMMPTKLPNISPSPTLYVSNTEDIQMYPSPTGKYVFYIYPIRKPNQYNFDECSFGLRINSENGNVDLSYNIYDFVGTEKIPCTEGMGPVNQGNFRYWLDEENFIFDNLDGKIYIIQALNPEIKKIYTHRVDYVFSLVSPDLKYWLFRKNPQSNPIYVLLNQDQEVVKDDIKFLDYELFLPLLDKVNNGIVFLRRKFRSLPTPLAGPFTTEVSARFDFLSFNDLSYQVLLTTDFVGAPGRGCGLNKLLSVPKEIIIKTDCIAVGDQYLGNDGNIHIKL